MNWLSGSNNAHQLQLSIRDKLSEGERFKIEMVVFVFKIVLLFVAFSTASSRDEIPDFEFDESIAASLRPQVQRESSLVFDDFNDKDKLKDINDFDEFFVDDDVTEPEHDIATKERIMHQTLFKALGAKDLKYKFSEVLPLLRALSKSQRMVFASIISAQITGGKPLTLDEVRATCLSNYDLIIKTTERYKFVQIFL